MKIILDVMGFENKVECAIIAAYKFIKTHCDVKITLAGDYEKIKPFLINQTDFDYIDTKQYVAMTDSPIIGLRKQDSSLALGLKKIANKEADAFISGGSTSCFIPLVSNIVSCFDKITKFGLLTNIAFKNKGFWLIDCGANVQVDCYDLYKFALMANEYIKITKKIAQPKIAVLNIGTEAHKGLQYHQKINQLLTNNKQINYVGFIEPRELLLSNDVDLLITDGYSGNIFLKSIEGGLKTILNFFKKEYKKPWNFFSYLFSLKIFKKMKKEFDYKDKSAAIGLGVKGVIVKTHGKVDEKQFYFALQTAYENVNNKTIELLAKKNYE